jgi:hypothetical protein
VPFTLTNYDFLTAFEFGRWAIIGGKEEKKE